MAGPIGLEPPTFRSEVQRANHYLTPPMKDWLITVLSVAVMLANCVTNSITANCIFSS